MYRWFEIVLWKEGEDFKNHFKQHRVCNGLKEYRVGRSVKKFFFDYFFGQKCVFYACFTLIWSWEGKKTVG